MGGFQVARPTLQPLPQQESPLEMYGNLVRLKGLQQQQQTQQQLAPLQVQAAQQENQQRQEAIDTQKAIGRAYLEAQGDPQKTAELAIKYHAQPQAAFAAAQGLTKAKMDTYDLVAKQGEQAKIQADLMQGAHDTVAAADPKDRPAVYQQQLQGLAQRGIDVSKMPPQYPGEEGFKYIGVGVKAHTQNIEEAFKASEVAKNTAQAASANAEAQVKQAEMPGGGLYAGNVTPKERFIQNSETARTRYIQGQENARNQFTQGQENARSAAKKDQPTADEKRRADLGQNLSENLDSLEEIVNRRPDLFGPVAGRITSAREFIGTSDPDIGALQTIEHQLGMVQQSTHSMRSATGVQAAATSIMNNFKNSPEGMKGAIKAARNSLKTFLGNANPGNSGTSGSQQSKPEAPDDPFAAFGGKKR